MPRLLERLHTLWTALRLRLRGKGQITLRSLARTMAPAKGRMWEQEENAWQA